MNVAIPLLAALLGTFLGGLLRSRGDRLALLRDRRLAAADDFLATASEVFIGLNQSMDAAPNVRIPDDLGNTALLQEWADKMESAVSQARTNAHEVTRHATRIELLFGRGSPTASAAMELVGALQEMTEALRTRTDIAGFNAAYERAVEALIKVTELASEQIDPTPWWERLPRDAWRKWRNGKAAKAATTPSDALRPLE